MSNIAVLGYGVVGSGTVELFYKNKESIINRAGKDLDIKYILDIRDFPDSPFCDKFVKDINVILNDSEVDIVAEVMEMAIAVIVIIGISFLNCKLLINIFIQGTSRVVSMDNI